MSGPAPRVVPVVVVVPPRVLLLDLAGPLEVLRKANLVQDALHYAVGFVGPAARAATSIGLALSGIGPLPPALPEGALVVVPGAADPPGGSGTVAPDEARAEAEIVAWLARSLRPGLRLMSICSGALLCGRAGLLDGYECTTHHAVAAELARLAPRARVRENRLFVADGERLTSAGITSGVDLMLHLVAREAGDATALAVARHLVVYLRRAGGDPQLSPWLAGRNHLHPAVHRAQDAVAADPARDWSVAALADLAHASPRHLSRLFNAHAGMSVSDYVNRMRLAVAQDLVTGSRLGLERVAERAGFASPRQFRRVWGRFRTGTPGALRRGPRG